MPKVFKNKCVLTCLNINFTITPVMYAASLPPALRGTGSLSDSRRKPGREKMSVTLPQGEKIYACASWIGHFYHLPLVIIYNRWGKRRRVISNICRQAVAFCHRCKGAWTRRAQPLVPAAPRSWTWALFPRADSRASDRLFLPRDGGQSRRTCFHFQAAFRKHVTAGKNFARGRFRKPANVY